MTARQDVDAVGRRFRECLLRRNDLAVEPLPFQQASTRFCEVAAVDLTQRRRQRSARGACLIAKFREVRAARKDLHLDNSRHPQRHFGFGVDRFGFACFERSRCAIDLDRHGPELRAIGCSDRLLAAAVADPGRYHMIVEDRPESIPTQTAPRTRPRATFYVDNTGCPDAAEVWIDGQKVETTPFAKPIPLASGPHVVVLKHPFASEESREILVKATETVQIEATMNVQFSGDAGAIAIDSDAGTTPALTREQGTPRSKLKR